MLEMQRISSSRSIARHEFQVVGVGAMQTPSADGCSIPQVHPQQLDTNSGRQVWGRCKRLVLTITLVHLRPKNAYAIMQKPHLHSFWLFL
jgi:hypothetical protein